MLSRIAADITTGNLQGEFRGTPRHVLYVVNEDSLNYTVKPRMVAAGATIEMIHFVGIEDGSVQLPRDMERIAVAAHQYNAACVMLDPLSANLELAKGGDQGPKLRKDMQYMRALCEQAQIAAIGLAHTRKAMTNNLMDAILGSTELGNVCRSAMGVIANPDEEGTYILSQEKANLGRLDVESYTYRIEPFSFLEDGEYIKTSRIEITGTTSIKVSDVLADSSLMDGGQMAEAKKFLKEYLEIHGAVNAKDIKKVAQSEGISISSLQRARKSLDVVVQRTGFGKDLVSVWSLPVAKTT
jgi:hypothetical protein